MTVNCFNCAVVNTQRKLSRIPHKLYRTETSCDTGYNKNNLTVTLQMRYAICV